MSKVYDMLHYDLKVKICDIILHEWHVTARLLWKQLKNHLNKMLKSNCAPTLWDVEYLAEGWDALCALRIKDDAMVAGCKWSHDIWLQLLEDPYEMRHCSQKLLDIFYDRVETAMMSFLHSPSHLESSRSFSPFGTLYLRFQRNAHFASNQG